MKTFDAWICRCNSKNDHKDCVHVANRKPVKQDNGCYGGHATRADYCSSGFKKLTGFLPRKGSCKKYEITLKELKKGKNKS